MSEYLQHHGIKGQKWGIRRFQNEDGSLTSEGKARYGGMIDHDRSTGNGASSLVRTVAKSSLYGRGHLREWRKENLQNKLTEAKRVQKETEADNQATKEQKKMAEKNAQKYERKLNAQKASDDNRKAYERHTSTGKMVVQDFLFTKFGSDNYRHARARGAGRIRSFFESGAGAEPIGTILRIRGDKKAYGGVAWSDDSEHTVI